jgi:hypothetical protein
MSPLVVAGLCQLAGAAAAVAAVTVLAGAAWGLLAAGIAALVIGLALEVRAGADRAG